MHRLPERCLAADRRQVGKGLEVITKAIGIPALHRQLLQGAVIDVALPSAPITHQQPIGVAVRLGFRQPLLAEFAQGRARLEHAKAPSGGVAHAQVLEDRFQGQHLGLVAGGPKAKPAQQHQPGAAEASAPQQ